MPRVSIVTPCYNGERFVGEAIESVLAQSSADWELIVVDDGSKDRSAQIAQRFASRDPRIRLVCQQNRGVNAARNAGYRESSPVSEYLLFFDSDDLLDPALLSTMTAYLDSHPEVVMALCRYRAIDENGRTLADPRAALPRYTRQGGELAALPESEPRIPFDTAFWWIDLPVMTALIRRSAYRKLPGWDETLGQGCEDTDLLLRFFLMGDVHSLQEVLVSYRKHAGQATKRAARMKQGRRVLHEKWLAGDGLTREQVARFRAEWRVYERTLLPRHLLSQARARLAAGDLTGSAKLAVHGAAHAAIARSFSLRSIAWPPLWYLA